VGTTSYGISGLRTSFPSLHLDSYQRSSCWPPKLKASFVRSIINDWPTGIVVLNRIEPKSGSATKLSASHDIIDGQQRMTAIYEFLENPLVYVFVWAPKAQPDEHPIIEEIRQEFNLLVKILRKKGSGYVVPGTKAEAVRKKIYDDVAHELKKRTFDDKAKANRQEFELLVDKVVEFHRAVAQRSLVMHELSTDTAVAEKMYMAINTQGKLVLWWELLRVGQFNKDNYDSSSGYSVKRTALIKQISSLYHAKDKIPARPSGLVPSLWDALYALDQYYQAYFAGIDPAAMGSAVDDERKKLKVDGLGFRLLTGFLSHEISRVAINDVLDNYSNVTICKAIDVLFDTADVLFKHGGKYKLFMKYSSFGAEVIPAYPMMSLIIAAAHMVSSSGMTSSLNDRHRESLRILTEQLFRQSICENIWSGSGDSRLKEWLDNYFHPSSRDGPTAGLVSPSAKPFPGGLKNVSCSYDWAVWQKMLANIQPSEGRTVPKEWKYFHFLIQYIVDSKMGGSLPKSGVAFDHIVPHNPTEPLTGHPFNFAAISSDLNLKKSGETFAMWSPTGLDKANYELQCVNGQPLKSHSGSPSPIDFLSKASIVTISDMINERRKIIEFVLSDLLTEWIGDGD